MSESDPSLNNSRTNRMTAEIPRLTIIIYEIWFLIGKWKELFDLNPGHSLDFRVSVARSRTGSRCHDQYKTVLGQLGYKNNMFIFKHLTNNTPPLQVTPSSWPRRYLYWAMSDHPLTGRSRCWISLFRSASESVRRWIVCHSSRISR